jgi:hypothetical protein
MRDGPKPIEERFVPAAVAGDEVILECADDSFSSVPAVEVWNC